MLCKADSSYVMNVTTYTLSDSVNTSRVRPSAELGDSYELVGSPDCESFGVLHIQDPQRQNRKLLVPVGGEKVQETAR